MGQSQSFHLVNEIYSRTRNRDISTPNKSDYKWSNVS